MCVCMSCNILRSYEKNTLNYILMGREKEGSSPIPPSDMEIQDTFFWEYKSNNIPVVILKFSWKHVAFNLEKFKKWN